MSGYWSLCHHSLSKQNSMKWNGWQHSATFSSLICQSGIYTPFRPWERPEINLYFLTLSASTRQGSVHHDSHHLTANAKDSCSCLSMWWVCTQPRPHSYLRLPVLQFWESEVAQFKFGPFIRVFKLLLLPWDVPGWAAWCELEKDVYFT